MKPYLPLTGLLTSILLLSSCSKQEQEGQRTARSGAVRLSATEIEEAINYDHPGASAYYEENPDFFIQNSIDALPSDLAWEDGTDQDEFASPKAIRGGTERIVIYDFPRTLRTVGPDSSTSFRGYIHDEHSMSLVKKHPNTGDYYPGLAAQWAIADDRKTVYFKIDPEARFSDGVPVLTKHFLFTFYFMRSPWIKAPWYNNWYNERYTKITAYDDRTFSVELKDAKPDTLRFFEEDLYPYPDYFYADFGEDFVTRFTWRFPPTTGPYIIRDEDIRKGRSLTQTRQEDWWAQNKKFWRNRYNPDRREFNVVRDPDKALEAFLSGDFEMYRIRTPDVWEEKLDQPAVNDGFIVRAQFANQVPRPCYSLRINKSKPLLDNPDIRTGLQYATNFEAVLTNYFRGQYRRMQTSSDGYGDFTHPSVTARSFSISEAEAAFAKAGFTERGPDGILRNSEGQSLTFTITTGYRRLTDVLTILQQEARKAGVDYRLEILEATAAWKKVQEKKHEITLAALNRSVERYPRYHDFWHSFNAYREDGSLKPDTNNFTVTANPEWDALIERYDASTDFEEIRAIAFDLEERIYEDSSFIPGWIRPFFQCAYWRWVQWPESFAGRLVREHDELNVHWIDPEILKETKNAMKEGASFPPKTLIFDTYLTTSS
ncbi:MAG: extracellular solute-binding protein [Verrucomicrobiota bacterium]